MYNETSKKTNKQRVNTHSRVDFLLSIATNWTQIWVTERNLDLYTDRRRRRNPHKHDSS